jgi:DNA-directed RNA polymerase specialized sigma24 family protein
LKLHTILDKKADSYAFRPGCVKWQAGAALINCVGRRKILDRRRKRSWRCSGRFKTSPFSLVLRQEANRELSEQLNRLPDHYKVPLMLRYYKTMSYCEIARRLNRGLPAVKMVIFRAKNRLRRNLSPFERAETRALFSRDTFTQVS